MNSLPLSERRILGAPRLAISLSRKRATSRAPMLGRRGRRPLAGELVDDVEDAQRAAVGGAGGDEVIGPDVIWCCCWQVPGRIGVDAVASLPQRFLRAGGTRWPSRRHSRSIRLRFTAPARVDEHRVDHPIAEARVLPASAFISLTRPRSPTAPPRSAASSGAGRRPDKPDAPTSVTPAQVGHRVTPARRATIFPLQVLQHRDVQRLLGHDALQT